MLVPGGGQLQASGCSLPAASTTGLQFYKTAVCRAVPCREPGAQFSKAATQFLTASVHWCSTAASGKFRLQVSQASAYRCRTAASYKLRCAEVPAATTTLLVFYKAAVCCARSQRLSLRGQAVR